MRCGTSRGIGSHDGSEAVYSHGDQIGSMRMLMYEGAAVGRQAVYTAFGERVWSDGLIGATRYQYAGAWGYQTFPEYAGEPGDSVPWIHVGHWWYDPATGRFLQRDPIGIGGGLNVYLYGQNSPTYGVDPSGMSWVSVVGTWIAGSGAVISTYGCAIGLSAPPNTPQWAVGQTARLIGGLLVGVGGGLVACDQAVPKLREAMKKSDWPNEQFHDPYDRRFGPGAALGPGHRW